MGDSPEGSQERKSSRRSRTETSYKAKAFEKFKQLKKGIKNKYEVEEVANVYDVVEEKEYVKTVLSKYDDDWIVDDDGSGYAEDGRDIFDEDVDSESTTKDSSKGKGTKRKSKNLSKNAGKGSIQEMLSHLPTKKKKEVNLDDDEMLSEILGEIETDSTPSTSVPKPRVYSGLAKKLAARDYMKNFSHPVKKRAVEVKLKPKENLEKSSCSVLKEVQPRAPHVSKNSDIPQKKSSECINGKAKETDSLISETPKERVSETPTETPPEFIDETPTEFMDETLTEQFEEDLSEGDFDTPATKTTDSQIIDTDMTQEDEFDDDLTIENIEDIEAQVAAASAKLAEEFQEEFETEWENFGNTTINLENESLLENSEIPLVEVEEKKVFRFFWWDAYEDPLHQRGVVFLIGKTYCEKTKKFMSCCVVVRNIDRRIFVLPRPFEVDQFGKDTEIPVTIKSVYDELSETVLKPLNVKTFRSKPTNKKYAFDPEVPAESEYLEVRYPATDPKIDQSNLRCHTFSKIFGTNTSCLEILFLDRKIKGPCWLDVSNPSPVSNPLSWCKLEITCSKITDLNVAVLEAPLPPPPIVVAAINMRTCISSKTNTHEIVMLTCLAHNKYSIDKQPPDPPFEQHFCVFSRPAHQILPPDMHVALGKYRATRVQKMDSEKALLNYFINQFAKIDPDLIVGHDLQGYQINILVDRLVKLNIQTFHKFGRLKRSVMKGLENSLFAGRLVCDMKISSKELIKSRSYDLDTLCQVVLKLKENQRIELEPEDIPKMFQTPEDIIKLISCTMQDTMYILKMMYSLNVVPLALQITNIAGNVMSRTLMGGRSDRNEFLLLHAFSEKGYILPDKEYKKNGPKLNTRKKPTYAGGLVLDPKIGFYDKLILLMDFNSLYPSIIQEFNICFTTLPVTDDDEGEVTLPDSSLPPGVLPIEIKKLVESRRQVKSLMKKPDLPNDLRQQYDIRQMALKLTANSMYGCLGFSHSRFYARNLAALVTQKGREILTNTKNMIEKMMYNVVYGDTDSIMIDTNILEYDEVFQIGLKIKQEVNKLYKQVELDIDGVFNYLLLLKKKKYAAVSLSKDKNGQLVCVKEYKGLDIVRRDWSQLASEAGKYVLDQILSALSPDERIENIHGYLRKVRDDLIKGRIPLQLLVITKQLNKEPYMYADKLSLPHVQVALRYNKNSGGHLRSGDTVNYVICDDNTNNSAVQRAYHVDELKNSPDLKIDYEYYLSQQIHPVITRICDPIEGTDSYQIAECLGIELKNIKKPKQAVVNETVENICRPEIKFRNVDKFKFICLECKTENVVDGPMVGPDPFLDKCKNAECKARPINYIQNIQNQLTVSIRSYIRKYYKNSLICEDPGCTNETRRLVLKFVRAYPVCNSCEKGIMYRSYNENQLYTQLAYFHHIFDLDQLDHKDNKLMDLEFGYQALQEIAEKFVNHSEYSQIDLGEVFLTLDPKRSSEEMDTIRKNYEAFDVGEEDEEENN